MVNEVKMSLCNVFLLSTVSTPAINFYLQLVAVGGIISSVKAGFEACMFASCLCAEKTSDL